MKQKYVCRSLKHVKIESLKAICSNIIDIFNKNLQRHFADLKLCKTTEKYE